jgi:hypothetical protein
MSRTGSVVLGLTSEAALIVGAASGAAADSDSAAVVDVVVLLGGGATVPLAATPAACAAVTADGVALAAGFAFAEAASACVWSGIALTADDSGCDEPRVAPAWARGAESAPTD